MHAGTKVALKRLIGVVIVVVGLIGGPSLHRPVFDSDREVSSTSQK
jgi:hypothetical protein